MFGKNSDSCVVVNSSGIAAQDLPYLFDRFYRRDRDHDIPGAGWGLAIATLIARCHGGQISVTSQIHMN
ncbi:MAG TPA: sensor histidine kinase [Coleofasciculaceae cyanobacterium]